MSHCSLCWRSQQANQILWYLALNPELVLFAEVLPSMGFHTDASACLRGGYLWEQSVLGKERKGQLYLGSYGETIFIGREGSHDLGCR